jgi:hypothetical protein
LSIEDVKAIFSKNSSGGGRGLDRNSDRFATMKDLRGYRNKSSSDSVCLRFKAGGADTLDEVLGNRSVGIVSSSENSERLSDLVGVGGDSSFWAGFEGAVGDSSFWAGFEGGAGESGFWAGFEGGAGESGFWAGFEGEVVEALGVFEAGIVTGAGWVAC